MTTPEAAAKYLSEYLRTVDNTPVVFNPLGLDIETLPFIYGFVNGGSPGRWHCCLISADGKELGGHLCSHPSYAPIDLGVVAGGLGESRHKEFRMHYPEGYRMAFVGYEDVPGHEGLNAAFAVYKVRYLEDEAPVEEEK